MNREILFRGKEVGGDGSWIFGSLVTYEDGTVFIAQKTEDANRLNLVSVDPSTVGQYTGVTNRKGQRIFEGDIIQEKGPVYLPGDMKSRGDRLVRGDVTWVSDESRPGFWAIGSKDENGNPALYSFSSDCILIGNIFNRLNF